MIPSGSELVVILLVVLILFGGKKLPEIARTIGKSVRQMQKASRDLQSELDLDAIDREDNDKPDLTG